MKTKKPYQSSLKRALKWPLRYFIKYWRGSGWHKAVTVIVALILLSIGSMYGIARWYIWSERNQPFTLGASFIPAYAESLGLDAQQTMDALIKDVGVRNFRLISYWDQGEPTPGEYNFTQLDWQFKKAEASHSKITLSVGLRQPRWPECHMPSWAANEQPSVWQPQLESYVAAVVNRYKSSPALASYQIENEYFLQGFGICGQIPGAMDRSRLINEYNLVKKLDSVHPLIVNRSNNALGWPVGQPKPDEFGISIYKRVWDAQVTHRYIEYPFPAWFYAFTAGWQKIATGKDMIIHEMQAESWGPNGKSLQDITAAEGDKSLDATRLAGRVSFAKGTGMKQAYLWGAEYWYFRMEKQHDPSLWNVARQEFVKPKQ